MTIDRRHPVVVIIVLATALLLAACQADPVEPPTADDGEPPTAPTSDDGRAADGPSGDETITDNEPVTEDPAPIPLPGLDEVVLTTGVTGHGTHPTFTWEPVEDAVSYQVTLYDDQDRAVWSWTTTRTEMVLGGFARTPPEGVRGPRLTQPGSWHVLARDVDGVVVAQSGRRPIAP